MASSYLSPSPSPPTLKLNRANEDESLFVATAALNATYGQWQVRPDIVYLDNGAFGGCPIPVVRKQREVRQWIEENPHDFFERSYVPSWEVSKRALASFINVNPEDLVLLPGATHGMNVVIQSLQFERDDEILTTNHAYSSVKLALEHVARRDGAHLVIVDIPLEVTGPADVLHRLLSSTSSRTRFAVIDHVPSRSGMILPIKEIVHELACLGVDTLVDGAHAAGMIPLDVAEINAAYYVANCHKWMCAPRGVGFLHVRPDFAHNIKPLVIGRSPYMVNKSKYSKLEHGFGWMGTSCPSAALSLPTCIDFLSNVVPGGYDGLINRNHELTVLARRIVCKALEIPIPSPDSMIGAMATIPLPDSPGPEQEGMLPIQQTLWKDYKIVIPVYSWPAYPKRVIRLSVQAYNTLSQYFYLAECLCSVLRDERDQWLNETGRCTAMSPQVKDAQTSEIKLVSAPKLMARNPISHKSNGAAPLEVPFEDIEDPELSLLIQLAHARIRRIVDGRFAASPITLYPTAGNGVVQQVVMCQAESRHANLEISRITHMLSCVDRRRVPQLMVPTISQLLNTDDVIESWLDSRQTLKNQGQVIIRTMMCQMAAPPTLVDYPVNSNDFVDRVVPYETENQKENLSLRFWQRALADFSSRGRWTLARVASFLQIHAFLKDPVSGLRNDFAAQAELFSVLLNSLRPALNGLSLSSTTWDTIAAQLALESSFISQPLVHHASHVHFSGDQQLVYSYAEIDQLARSEFACPSIVIGMIHNALTSAGDECEIAPIAVAHCYPICSSHDARVVVIDGNNRTTTVAFLRFISTYGVPEPEDLNLLRDYCRDHALGPIFFVDMCAVLRMLWKERKDTIELLKRSDNIRRFQEVRKVPVLVTEESSFLTKFMGDGAPNVLQPVHQYIFATDDLLVAFPSKMQSHGRSNGYKAMPLR